MNARFTTLLRREWLQHHRAWLLLAAVPPLVMLGLLTLGQLQIDIDGNNAAREVALMHPGAIAMLCITAAALLAFVLAWGSALIQAPGLARRDLSDRSIEFWLALPVGHGAALAAPLLAHLLLFPLAALVLGALAGVVLTPLALARFASLGDWLSLPWGSMAAGAAALLLRCALGLVLASLWLSPLVLLVMAASAWLRRWGLPAVVAGVALIGGVLDKMYGNPVVTELGSRLLTRAGQSFVTGRTGRGVVLQPGEDPTTALQALPGWALRDAGHALQALADPLLPAALAVAAGAFALLVLRRRRGG
jgi:hypothetical protein